MTKRNFKQLTVLLCSILLMGNAATSAADASFELHPGVVVDPSSKRVYWMTPRPSVEALNIENGDVEWSVPELAKPLSVGGDLLVCQWQPKEAASSLQFILLDTRQKGKREGTAEVALPNNVRARIDHAMEERFNVHAKANATDSFIAWEFQVIPVQGRMSVDAAPDQASPKIQDPDSQVRGFVKLDLRSRQASPAQADDAAPELRDIAPKSMTASPGGKADPSQRLSIDGKHLLKSERTGDARVWERYEWSIIDTGTGEKVGQTKSHLSQSAFIVVGSRLIVVTGPFSRRTDKGMENQPLMIRGIDLEKGEQVWSQPVRDTEYRGEYPP